MARALKVVFFQSKDDGLWYFHVKAGNGRKICASEGYTRKSDAVKTAKLLLIDKVG